MIVERVAVVEVEFPSGAEPSVDVDLKFVIGLLVDVIFVESIKAVVRFQLELPKGVRADEDVGEEGHAPVREGRFQKFVLGPCHV